MNIIKKLWLCLVLVCLLCCNLVSGSDTAGFINNTIVDSYEFDPFNNTGSVLCRMGSSDYFLNAWTGNDTDGFVCVLYVDPSDGSISRINTSWEFNTTNARGLVLRAVGVDIYSIAFVGASYVTVVTFRAWANNGTLNKSILSTRTLTYGGQLAQIPVDLINMTSNNVWACAYSQVLTSDGFIESFYIYPGNGTISAVLDTVEFDTSNGWQPRLVLLDSDTVGIFYESTGQRGKVKTWNISSAGDIAVAYSDYWIFQNIPDVAYGLDACWIGGCTYAVVFYYGYGYVVTMNILPTGHIVAEAYNDTLKLGDSAGAGYYPSDFRFCPVNTSDDLWGVSYYNETFVDWAGQVSTFRVYWGNGSISKEIDSQVFESPQSNTFAPWVPCSGNYFIVTYEDDDNDGWVKTLEIYKATWNDGPTIVVNMAGEQNGSGGPYYLPPGETTAFSGDGYFVNNSWQDNGWFYVNLSVSDVDGVDKVWFNLLNGTTWTNYTYRFTKRGGYYELNSSKNFSTRAGYNYSFDVVANDSLGASTVCSWSKVGLGGDTVRRFVQLNCSVFNITYRPWYMYTHHPYSSLYGLSDLVKPDRLYHDQGASNIDHIGVLLNMEPDNSMSVRQGKVFTGYWFDDSLCVLPFDLQNVYYHFWSSVASYERVDYIGWNQTRDSLRDYTDMVDYWNTSYNESKSTVKVTGLLGGFYNNTFQLSCGKLTVTSTRFSYNDIYEFNIVMQSKSGGGSQYFASISNRTMNSFILFNVPDNSTLNASYADTDGDGLSDWNELYRNWTNPFLSDTDGDGVDDKSEVDGGYDPNNWSSKPSAGITLGNNSPVNGTCFWVGSATYQVLVFSINRTHSGGLDMDTRFWVNDTFLFENSSWGDGIISFNLSDYWLSYNLSFGTVYNFTVNCSQSSDPNVYSNETFYFSYVGCGGGGTVIVLQGSQLVWLVVGGCVGVLLGVVLFNGMVRGRKRKGEVV